MSEFDTLEQVAKLFRDAGCEGQSNCYFVARKDQRRAKSGVVGGMEYPYDAMIINQTENGLGMIYLNWTKTLTLNNNLTEVAKIRDVDAPFRFIPNEDIVEMNVKEGKLFDKGKVLMTIKTVDKKKHPLIAFADEQSLPWHAEGLRAFESRNA